MMNDIKKRLAKLLFPIANYIPFNNKMRLKGCDADIKNSIVLKCRINCSGHNNSIVCEKGSILQKCNINIIGNNNRIIISEGVKAVDVDLRVENDGNEIIIGRMTRLCGHMHFACCEGTRIQIGEDCLFGSGVILRTSDSHSILSESGVRINKAKDIEIGNHVWIAHGVQVNKGVKIMDNSVLGAGAIVTSSFDEGNVVIAGVPAKILKNGIDWLDERV